MAEVGDEVRFELGLFIAVAPSCEFTITDIRRDDFGVALSGQLTDAQARELSEFLSLERFDGLEGLYAYGSSCGIGASATTRIAWGERRIQMGCFGPPLPDALREDLVSLLTDLVSLMSPWGRPADGPIRYMVFRQESPGGSNADEGSFLEWPLDASAEVLSYVDPDNDFLGSGRPRIWEATGDDAARLRSLREAFVARNPKYQASIPVMDSTEQRYLVVMRDVVKFEANARPFVPWATDGGLVIEANSPATTSELRYRVTCGATPSSPSAEGSLETFSDDESQLYWRAKVSGLPPGDCDVTLDPVDPSETLACNPALGPTPPAEVFIPAGWDASTRFFCREPR